VRRGQFESRGSRGHIWTLDVIRSIALPTLRLRSASSATRHSFADRARPNPERPPDLALGRPAQLPPQRHRHPPLELHHNVPLLVALILAGPGIARSRRVRSLLIALSLLSLTHVLDFVLAIHWHYAFHNVGQYRVTDLHYLKRTLWESLDNPVQVAKLLILNSWAFYSSVGQLLMPILLWMILCRDTSAAEHATAPEHDG